jgi:Flp pilus assembly protein TadB
VGAFFASTFVLRKLTTIDRVMLSCVAAVYLVVFWLGEQLMLWGIGLIAFCLGVSWRNGRVQRRHHSHSRGSSADLGDTLRSPR